MLESLRSSLAALIAPREKQVPGLITGEHFPATSNTTFRGPLSAWRLERAYNEMPWLRAAVHKIAESIGAVTWTVETAVDEQGEPVRARRLQRASVEERARLRRQLDMRDESDHPLADILEDGNPLMTGSDVFQLLQSYIELAGNGVAAIQQNALGMPVALWPIASSWIMSFPTLRDPFFRLSTHRFGSGTLPLSRALWVRDPNPVDPYGGGVGTALALGDELDTDEYAAGFVKAFFANGAVPDALVGFDGVDDASVKAHAEEWSRNNRGVQRAHRVHFFNHKPDVEVLGHAFKDQEVVELRRFVRDTVQQVYGVPPEALGIIENSNRATIDAASFMLARWVLVPRLERMRRALQSQLVPMFDERLVVDYESPVPEDKGFSLEVVQAAPWAFERGEIRELGGASAREGDDVHLVPLNLVEEPAPDQDTSDGRAADPVARSATRAVDEGDIERIALAATAAEFAERLGNLWEDELQKWGSRVLRDMDLAVSFSLVNPETTAHLAEFAGERIVGANRTTQAAIRATLSEGVAAGEGVPQLASRVRDVFDDADKRRSIVIARTEVIRSSGFGTLQGFKQSGLVERKRWIATPLPQVRHSGTELDGQEVALNSPFTIDGFTAQHPGDFGVPEHDVQCRCSVTAVVAEAASPGDAKIWRRDERRRRSWERKATRVLRQGFGRQRRAVLAELRRAAG